MTMLSIIQDACGRLSLVQPTVVVGSTDKQVIQLLALLNQEGKDLATKCAWQALTEQGTFVTVAAATQPGAIPADFDRFIPNTFFNRTTRRPITGPITPLQWQWIQAQPVYSAVYLAFRIRTGSFLMAPTPPAGQSVYFEYVSKYWALSAALAAKAKFTVDTDTSYLDEELLTLGLEWRYLRAKGLDYAEEMETYERQVEQSVARDGGSSALSIAPQPIDLNRVNLPDGNFPVA